MAPTPAMRRVLHDGHTPSALHEKGYEALVAAVETFRTGEAVGQDTAPEVGPEAALYIGWRSEAHGIGLGRLVQERLQ